jgi:hypothetical protein
VPPLVAEGVDDWWGGVRLVEHFSIRVSRASSGSIWRSIQERRTGAVVGLDWAETHHDVAVMDESGRVVTARRVAEGLAGLTAFHELLASLVTDPAES